MAKVIDITDKLSFEGNPQLVIKGKKVEVNGDAHTMLTVLGLMGSDDPSPKEIKEAYEALFPEKSQAIIKSLKIQFKDLMVVIQEAIGLLTGGNESGGE